MPALRLRMAGRIRGLWRAGLAAALSAVLVSGSTARVVAVSPAPVPSGPAGAGTCATQAQAARANPTLATLRAFGDCEIGRRQQTLPVLTSFVRASHALTVSDREVLLAEIGSTLSGLSGLKATIDAETGLLKLRAEIVQVTSRYGVYSLLGPKVYLVNAADGILAVEPDFSVLSADLADRIAAAKAAGKDVSAAQAALDSMNAEVAAAVALAAPLPAQLLSLTPAGVANGTAGPVLRGAREAVAAARDHLRAALGKGRAVLAALR
jgi:hypothetical protein